MTIEEYIIERKCKPLSKKELSQGKSQLKIYGTAEPMPWSTIYTRLAAGQGMDEIAHMYGHGRKIALWAQQDNVMVQPLLEQTVEKEIEHRERLQAITNADPEVASTIMEMVNEIAPDFTTKVAQFADKVVSKSLAKLDDKYLEAADIVSLVKAVQGTTDIVGHTQRHANATQITNNSNKIVGFGVILDEAEAAKLPTTITEAEVIEDDR